GILTVQIEPDQRLPPGEPVPPDRGRVLLPEHLSGRWRLEKWWGYAVAGHHQTDRIPHVQGHGELLIIPDGQRPGGLSGELHGSSSCSTAELTCRSSLAEVPGTHCRIHQKDLLYLCNACVS